VLVFSRLSHWPFAAPVISAKQPRGGGPALVVLAEDFGPKNTDQFRLGLIAETDLLEMVGHFALDVRRGLDGARQETI
jgi:hypothetical protein